MHVLLRIAATVVSIMHGLYNLITNHTQYTEVCLACPFIVSVYVIDADAKNNSVAPQAETVVPLQAEDCSRADLAVARTSRT
jgi:hypothetical protein